MQKHPTFRDGTQLAASLAAGRVISDMDASIFNYRDKEIEFNPRINGVKCAVLSSWFSPLEGWQDAVASGYTIFAYSGRGCACEVRRGDGQTGWFTNTRFTGPLNPPQHFEPVQARAEASAHRVTSKLWFGVRIPRKAALYDCRLPEELMWKVSDGGRHLWGADRAAHAMGLLGGQAHPQRYDLTGLQISFHFDARLPETAHETARILRTLRKQLASAWRQYRSALRGGHATYGSAF